MNKMFTIQPSFPLGRYRIGDRDPKRGGEYQAVSCEHFAERRVAMAYDEHGEFAGSVGNIAVPHAEIDKSAG
ncbi:hypothetical protein ACT3UD_11710 [Glutamicibacter sp. 287]|uniref:hypothetical protein n=1 Tax=unclassified Glutamicibacter TaxID=2627139 RepID=UPI000BB80A8F|nr:hypothetical protein [Glutamicibacter sp. BW80]PCC28793.1 hypothetical protein CIK76_08705 [Glutamicibacter sp. BW80]